MAKPFEYSDGAAVESRVVQLLQAAEQLDSATQIAAAEQARSWPVRYHLAAERGQLLQHFDFSGLDLLELGAGMGAVSRQLAEQAASLTVVEGSAERFAGLSARLRDLDNWRGEVGRIEQFSSAQKYDVVLMIGVLEYAELHVEMPAGWPGDAFDFMLERACSHLRPGGVLLVAIENRLGVKYWCGAAEDHTGCLFDGLVGYPATPSPRTFSRRELAARLERVGLEHRQEFLPFPDYKLPRSVIRPRLAEVAPELAADLACYESFETGGQRRSHLLPDELVLDGLTQAGLLAEHANSFLVAATAGADSPVLRRLIGEAAGSANGSQILAWHYSRGRRQPTVSKLVLSADGELRAEKSALVPTAGGASSELRLADGRRVQWRPAKSTPVARGRSLRLALLRDLYFDQWPAFLDRLEDFCRWVHRRLPGSDGELAGEALDAVLTNAVLTHAASSRSAPAHADHKARAAREDTDRSGQDPPYELFDLEWHLAGGTVSRTWHVLRNVVVLGASWHHFHGAQQVRCLAELYGLLCRRLELTPDLAADLAREAGFQGLVGQETEAQVARRLEQLLDEPFAERHGWPRVAGFAEHLRSVEQAAAERIEGEVSRLHERDAELASAYARLQEVGNQQQALAAEFASLDRQLQETRRDLQRAEDELAAASRREAELQIQLADSQRRAPDLARELEARRRPFWRVWRR